MDIVAAARGLPVGDVEIGMAVAAEQAKPRHLEQGRIDAHQHATGRAREAGGIAVSGRVAPGAEALGPGRDARPRIRLTGFRAASLVDTGHLRRRC